MQFNNHEKLEGRHAFLGASNFRWINWDEETLEKRYYGQYSTTLGTAIHALAQSLIRSRMRLRKTDKNVVQLYLYQQGIPRGAYNPEDILSNLAPFVNDAIGYHMYSEVILYYSMQSFGTADAISFNEKEKILRIHDLKTGLTKTHMEQLLVYAALFCLEYRKKPQDFKTELRIYQNDEVLIYEPDAAEIEKFMYFIKEKNQSVLKYLERDYR